MSFIVRVGRRLRVVPTIGDPRSPLLLRQGARSLQFGVGGVLWFDRRRPRLAARASYGLRTLGPFVSNRRDAYDCANTRPYDYLFIDEAELSSADGHVRTQRIARGELELTTRHQNLALYRTRKGPQAAEK